jgi:hypothetical protein
MLGAVIAATVPGPVSFVIAVVIAAAISTGVFSHAHRRGNRHATAWGVGAFLAAGVVVPVYFLRYWLGGRPSRGAGPGAEAGPNRGDDEEPEE